MYGKIKFEDPSKLLPPGFKEKVIAEDVTTTTTTEKPATVKPKGIETLLSKAKIVDVNAFLPPGFVLNTTENASTSAATETTKEVKSVSTVTASTSTSSGGIVFPTRPGGQNRKTTSTTTKKPAPSLVPLAPKILKGWPVR